MSQKADSDEAGSDKPKKKSKVLLFGLLGAVLMGGGSFYGVYSGMIPLPFGESGHAGSDLDDQASVEGGGADHAYHAAAPGPAAYVPLDAMIISLGPEARSRHLKVDLSVEVEPGSEGEIEAVKPRIRDVLNTFLRAVDERDIEIPRAMLRLRAQMLRRVQLVTPPGAVRDLLIQEFVLN